MKRARTRLPAVAEGAFRLLADDRRRAPRADADDHRAAAGAGAARRRSPRPPRCARPPRLLPGDAVGAARPRARVISRALERRLAKYAENPARDAKHAGTVADWWQRYASGSSATGRPARTEPGLAAFRWLLEELQVSLFAQELRTPFPVSYKRVEKAWAALRIEQRAIRHVFTLTKGWICATVGASTDYGVVGLLGGCRSGKSDPGGRNGAQSSAASLALRVARQFLIEFRPPAKRSTTP